MARSFLEIGKSGYKHANGYVYDEFLSSLSGRTGIRTYREMRDNDPIIGACMHAINQIMREARWSVKVPDGGSEEDVKFLQSCMGGMQHSWADFIANVLTMLVYGWAWFEIVYVRRGDNKIGWRKLAFRHQGSYEKWELDDVGDVLGFWQRPAPDYRALYMPESKSLHFKTDPHGGNPEGRSILRNAFKPYYYKKVVEEIEGIGIERDLTGLPILKLPEGIDPNDTSSEVQQTIEAAKRLVSNIRRDEQDGVLLPYGWEFTLASSPGVKQFDMVSTINRYNKEIAVTVLAQFVMLGMERTGSYALAKEQTEMFYLCLEGWMDCIATQFNRIAVPRLFAMNGKADVALPYVVHTPIRKYTLKDLAEFVSKLTSGAVPAIDVDTELKSFLKNYARLTEYSELRP